MSNYVEIISSPNYMFAYTPDEQIVWAKGSHTARVFAIDNEVDVFSFAWEKNETSMLDFTSALENWMKDNV